MVSDADLARALDVREGLRALLMAHNGEPLDAERVDEARPRRAPVPGARLLRRGRAARARRGLGGVDGALARLLAIVATAAEQGAWERLKACPRDCCIWAFYDRSKNRSGRWCSDGRLRQRREGPGVPEQAQHGLAYGRNSRCRHEPTLDRVDLEQVRAAGAARRAGRP